MSAMRLSASSLVTALGWCLFLGVLGGTLTRLDPWYFGLRVPEWKPPDWAFGPVWTVIFLGAGTALVLAWNAPGTGGAQLARLVGVYLANGMLNLLWSYLFFWRRRPDLALVETALLWLSIVAMIGVVAPLTRVGAALLVPYLLWVSLAMALTRAVVRLNGPFAP